MGKEIRVRALLLEKFIFATKEERKKRTTLPREHTYSIWCPKQQISCSYSSIKNAQNETLRKRINGRHFLSCLLVVLPPYEAFIENLAKKLRSKTQRVKIFAKKFVQQLFAVKRNFLQGKI